MCEDKAGACPTLWKPFYSSVTGGEQSGMTACICHMLIRGICIEPSFTTLFNFKRFLQLLNTLKPSKRYGDCPLSSAHWKAHWLGLWGELI